MSHYFSKDNDNLKSNEKTVYAIIEKKRFAFITDIGVFSKFGLDFGTRLMIETIMGEKAKKVLDLGCGYGPVGVVLGDFWKDSEIIGLDINGRAVKLANKNAELNKVGNYRAIIGDGLKDIPDNFDLIITNPPIRAGKKVIYRFFEESVSHLAENGSFVFVMNKKQGALTAIRKCETIFSKTNVLATKSGYMIVRCENN